MSISARRQVLANVQLNQARFPHAGLWLDKFLPKQFAQGKSEGEGAYRDHFEQAVKIPVADVYTSSFNRWKHTLEASGVKTKVATAQGRLVVGLGAESVLENAITLHRTYGVPVIPGSALKGLAAAYARNRLTEPEWQKGGEAYKTLFGDTNSAGYVTFFDALYVPDNAKDNRPLALDVVTVHHPEYYRGENSPPADWDSPNPVPFVSVRDGVKFLVALAGPEEWVETAFQILGLALAEEGIGAKTNSGYGRMVLEGYAKGVAKTAEPRETYHLAKLRLLKQETPPPGRYRGEVVEVRGRYGFINPAQGGGKIFVHVSQLQSGATSLQVGQVVEYSLGKYKGKMQAQKVDVLLEPD